MEVRSLPPELPPAGASPPRELPLPRGFSRVSNSQASANVGSAVRRRLFLVALSSLLVVTSLTDRPGQAQPPEPAAEQTAVSITRARFAEFQLTLDRMTLPKRREYKMLVAVEAELAAARRRLASDEAGMYLGLRGLDQPLLAEVLRWRAIVVHVHLMEVALLSGQRDELEDSLRDRRDEMRGVLSEIHPVIHQALAAVGRDTKAWQQLWPIEVLDAGILRTCPVAGPWSLTDTFGAPRPGGRTHQGNDIIAAWETPVIAAHDGTAVRAENPLGGRAVVVYGVGGSTYYAHLTSYGATGSVQAGDVIGFVGNSGNARGRIHHLHFEWRPGGVSVNPFRLLLGVCRSGSE
jgi:murein DD-endopeptidase MepM/ murein hydrolase activator NlpD